MFFVGLAGERSPSQEAEGQRGWGRVGGVGRVGRAQESSTHTSHTSHTSHTPLLLLLAISSVLLPAKARSQILPDRTLGSENSVATPELINNIESQRISGGATRGSSLFHSFQEFSIEAGRGAYFTNPAGIENILTRVTGSNPSTILGTLGVLGQANLFLLNPNGIVFGAQARLDLRGSFLGTSANSLLFQEGFEFSATNPEAPPLLVVNIPIGLRFRDNPAAIVNQSNALDSNGDIVGLQILPGETLALVGGDIHLDGGSIQAVGGRIELGGLSSAGTVSIFGDSVGQASPPVPNQTNNPDQNPDSVGQVSPPLPDQNFLRLDYPADVERADVALTNEGFVSAAGEGGNIIVQARNFNLAQESILLAGVDSNLASDLAADLDENNGLPADRAGDIDINATGSIALTEGSSIANIVQPNSTGNGGNIKVTAGGSVSLAGASQFITSTFGRGNAGNVAIAAGETISFDGSSEDGLFSSGAFSSVNRSAIGNGGDITLTANSAIVSNGGQLSTNSFGEGDAGNISLTANSAIVSNGGQLSTSSFGEGDAGNIAIAANNTVTFEGTNSRASSILDFGGVGNGGDITISTGSLTVRDGGQLRVDTAGQGNGGNLKIVARGNVSFDGNPTGAFGRVDLGGIGRGGNIEIEASSLSVSNEAQLQVLTLAEGDAGNITITTSDRVSLNDGSILSQVLFSGVGNGGSIAISTGSFSAIDGGRLSAVSAGVGNAGSINIVARSRVDFDGSNALSSASQEAVGNANDINIATKLLTVRNGAALIASSEGDGASGNIQVRADSIRLENEAFLGAETRQGEGNINLRSRDILLRQNSNITTSAFGEAAGGNIAIDAENLAALENSDIRANSEESFGGRVIVNAEGIFGTQFRDLPTLQSDITATSQLGPEFSGTVEINTPDVDPSSGLIQFPTRVVDPEELIAQNPCEQGVESAFIITGRGGLPPNPNQTLEGDLLDIDLVEPAPLESYEFSVLSYEFSVLSFELGNIPRVSSMLALESFEFSVFNFELEERANNSNLVTQNSNPKTENYQITPARGWIRNDRGEVVLTADDPTGRTAQRQNFSYPICGGL
ncbi:MAG: S-layer family protein [Oscillatoria sp. SIO1A7]|nr:S-layer family protein [Oscillatoria sp. SIO1A7]